MTSAFPLHRDFSYKDGVLRAENVSVAAMHGVAGTPCYIYSKSALVSRYRELADAFGGLDVTICYALKALPNIHVVRLFGEMGAGADVVSMGEMQRAIEAGIPANKIAFPGVAKTRVEIDFALSAGVMQFNVESESELRMIQDAAKKLNIKTRAVLRVNPDVDAKTHKKITTGKKENKFGIDLNDVAGLLRLAQSMTHVDVIGIGAHIGSQILDLSPFRDAYKILRDWVIDLRAQGFAITHVDLGGGLGVAYHAGQNPPEIADYAAIVREMFGDLNVHLVLEPGRWLVANAGLLLIAVHHIKQGEDKLFILTDGGMNDLIRPTLYDAHHDIIPVRLDKNAPKITCDVVGPVCESSDYLALSRQMAAVSQGDLLAVCSAGAYGASMASEFNSRPLVPEILVDGDSYKIIRRRPSFQEMIRLEKSSA